MAYVDDLVKAHIELKRNWQKIPVRDDIVIPDSVDVHCPLVGQKLIPAAQNCPACPQFHGVGVMMEASTPERQEEIENQYPWWKRHAICCITIMELPCAEGKR